MKCEWKVMKLSDIAQFNPKEIIKKGEIAKKIPMDILRPFTRDISTYSMEAYSGGAKFRNGDTIMARITPCLENGKIAKVGVLEDGEVGFGSTEYIVLRAIDGVCDADFLFYLVNSPAVREPAIKSMVGSSGRQRVQIDVVKNLQFSLPEVNVQKSIASVLKTLDDKIENNRKINENLEEQAKAIFQDWFVDFTPFGGVMPEGWTTGCLLDIASYLNGLAMQKFRPLDDEIGLPVLKIKELRQGHCDNNSELCSPSIKSDYIIHDGDVIFSWSGSLLVDIWCGNDCGLNQHLFKVTSSKYDTWFYYLWTAYHLNDFIHVATDKATTMGHIKREELVKAKVFIPSSEDYAKISDIIKPIIDMIITNRIESRELAICRDTLLPRLMSGEIDVSDIQL